MTVIKLREETHQRQKLRQIKRQIKTKMTNQTVRMTNSIQVRLMTRQSS